MAPELMRYADDAYRAGPGVKTYTTNYAYPQDIRSFLIGLGRGLEVCLLVGNLPATWYKMDIQWDLPPNATVHEGFPCDLSYMVQDDNWLDGDTDDLYDEHTDGSGDKEAYI